MGSKRFLLLSCFVLAGIGALTSSLWSGSSMDRGIGCAALILAGLFFLGSRNWFSNALSGIRKNTEFNPYRFLFDDSKITERFILLGALAMLGGGFLLGLKIWSTK